MVAGFLSLREPKSNISRGHNFMRQIFKIADENRSGTLTREEIRAAFYADAVNEKLISLGLKVPDWLEGFDAIDADGDEELSWAELSRGMNYLWGATGSAGRPAR